MKTQITYRKTDGSEGVALVEGDVKEPLQAKRELAHYLDLPTSGQPAGEHEDIDRRLQQGGIDPASVTALHISE